METVSDRLTVYCQTKKNQRLEVLEETGIILGIFYETDKDSQ